MVRAWWISQFWRFFLDTNFAGQLMHMGCATVLAEAGAVPDLIMGSDWWTSVAWTSYVQKNPVLLHALLLAHTTHFQLLAFAYTPAHHDHISLFVTFFLISPIHYKKKKPSLTSLYTLLPWFTLFTSCFLLNTCRIYVANPSCWAEIELMVISCSCFGSGQFPNHLSAYKSEALSGEHRWLGEFKLVYTSLISMSPLHSNEKGHSLPSENSCVYARVVGPWCPSRI